MRKHKLLIILFFTLTLQIQAQVNDDLDGLKSAYLNIQNGDYNEAYTYFSEILKLYPKEPIYNYYVGRCLLYLEKEPSRSLKYLRFASTKEVPVDVYYYIGIAYIKDYQFGKALKSLQLFEKRARKKQIKELELTNYISIAKNGLYLTKYIRKPSVYSKDQFEKNSFFENYFIADLEGRFVDYYKYFNQNQDSLFESSIMFVPNSIEKNEVLYFSQINEKRGDYDIYRITRLSDTAWSKPENLGEIINTPFDESYPYMHSDGSTLYFASKGHYSMGGYDLYRSTWDWNTQEWTEPENLDFPINSPYNDILFVPSPNKKNALFASERESERNHIMVYKLKLNNSEPYIELKNHDEILKHASLDVNVSQDNSKKEGSETGEYKASKSKLVKIKDHDSFLHKTEYDSLLNLAINYQLKADSLSWVIDERRSDFDLTEDSEKRAMLSNIIIELEMNVYILQKKADNCYGKVREIEQTNLASRKMIYEEVNAEKKSEETKIVKRMNVFIEPVQDSLNISKLSARNEIKEDSAELIDLGLRIEIPSIYNSENPIPTNESLSSGVIYMIQLGAFSSEKSPVIFKGLTPLSIVKKENSNIRKYFTGKFVQLMEAEKKIPLVKSKGFKDAYIVAFNDGKIIPVKNAVKLESKEIPTTKVKTYQNKEEIEEVELDIIFVVKGHVNVGDSLIVSKLKLDLPEEKELYLDEKENLTQVIIKSFSNYDEAEVVKRILDKKGIKETEIHAYFAENQIPLKQARKITK